MKIKHKAPGFVSMWMLDVFCCALGCVTLLWLLKTRDASLAWDQTQTVQAELLETQLNLFDRNVEAMRLSADIEELQKNLALTNEQKTEANAQLALVRKERDETEKNLALARKEFEDQAKNLATVKDVAEKNARNLALAEKTAKDAEALLKSRREEAETLAKKSTSLEKDLAKKTAEMASLTRNTLDAKSRQEELERMNAQLAAEIKEMRLRTANNSASVDELKKKLDQAAVQLIDLQGTKAKLADKLNKMQIEKDNKFAGIALTGRKVVFLVDMSGSMERTDENTVAPHKWPIVAGTVAKIMRSLPNLEKYQIIMFSNRLVYPLGQSGEWLDYEAGKSETKAEEAVKGTRPLGETNMYEPFEAAFRMRSKGLDTIYLLSDGLPNAGPGLSPTQQQAVLSESQLGDILGKHIRQTMNRNWNRPDTQGQKVRINSVGFFYESPDVGAFLWALSRENDGSFVGMSKP